jgi:hypothetical protein
LVIFAFFGGGELQFFHRRGQRFDDLQELRQEVMNIILNMKTEQFEKIFDDWLKRCEKCVELKKS